MKNNLQSIAPLHYNEFFSNYHNEKKFQNKQKIKKTTINSFSKTSYLETSKLKLKKNMTISQNIPEKYSIFLKLNKPKKTNKQSLIYNKTNINEKSLQINLYNSLKVLKEKKIKSKIFKKENNNNSNKTPLNIYNLTFAANNKNDVFKKQSSFSLSRNKNFFKSHDKIIIYENIKDNQEEKKQIHFRNKSNLLKIHSHKNSETNLTNSKISKKYMNKIVKINDIPSKHLTNNLQNYEITKTKENNKISLIKQIKNFNNNENQHQNLILLKSENKTKDNSVVVHNVTLNFFNQNNVEENIENIQINEKNKETLNIEINNNNINNLKKEKEIKNLYSTIGTLFQIEKQNNINLDSNDDNSLSAIKIKNFITTDFNIYDQISLETNKELIELYKKQPNQNFQKKLEKNDNLYKIINLVNKNLPKQDYQKIETKNNNNNNSFNKNNNNNLNDSNSGQLIKSKYNILEDSKNSASVFIMNVSNKIQNNMDVFHNKKSNGYSIEDTNKSKQNIFNNNIKGINDFNLKQNTKGVFNIFIQYQKYISNKKRAKIFSKKMFRDTTTSINNNYSNKNFNNNLSVDNNNKIINIIQKNNKKQNKKILKFSSINSTKKSNNSTNKILTEQNNKNDNNDKNNKSDKSNKSSNKNLNCMNMNEFKGSDFYSNLPFKKIFTDSDNNSELEEINHKSKKKTPIIFNTKFTNLKSKMETNNIAVKFNRKQEKIFDFEKDNVFFKNLKKNNKKVSKQKLPNEYKENNDKEAKKNRKSIKKFKKQLEDDCNSEFSEEVKELYEKIELIQNEFRKFMDKKHKEKLMIIIKKLKNLLLKPNKTEDDKTKIRIEKQNFHSFIKDYMEKYQKYNLTQFNSNKMKLSQDMIKYLKKNKNNKDINDKYYYIFENENPISYKNSNNKIKKKKRKKVKKIESSSEDFSQSISVSSYDDEILSPKNKKNIELLFGDYKHKQDNTGRRVSLTIPSRFYKRKSDFLFYRNKSSKKTSRIGNNIKIKDENHSEEEIDEYEKMKRKKFMIYEKRLYDFFSKVQKLKNKEGENMEKELDLLIDERMKDVEFPFDKQKQMRMNSFYNQYKDDRNREKYNYIFSNKKIQYMSPLRFHMTTYNGK